MPAKKVEEEIETEFASSKPVDYFNAWVEKATLTDDEINRWISMQFMHQNDEIIAPPPYIHPLDAILEEPMLYPIGKPFI